MTDHVHLPATPETDRGPGRLMKSLGQRYVQYVNRTDHRTGGASRAASAPRLSKPTATSSLAGATSNATRCGRAGCPPRENTPGRATAAMRSDSSTPLSLRTRFIAFAPDIQTDLRVGAGLKPAPTSGYHVRRLYLTLGKATLAPPQSVRRRDPSEPDCRAARRDQRGICLGQRSLPAADRRDGWSAYMARQIGATEKRAPPDANQIELPIESRNRGLFPVSSRFPCPTGC